MKMEFSLIEPKWHPRKTPTYEKTPTLREMVWARTANAFENAFKANALSRFLHKSSLKQN